MVDIVEHLLSRKQRLRMQELARSLLKQSKSSSVGVDEVHDDPEYSGYSGNTMYTQSSMCCVQHSFKGH